MHRTVTMSYNYLQGVGVGAYKLVLLEYGSGLYTKDIGSRQSSTFVHPMANPKHVVFHTIVKLFWDHKIPEGIVGRFRRVEQTCSLW